MNLYLEGEKKEDLWNLPGAPLRREVSARQLGGFMREEMRLSQSEWVGNSSYINYVLKYFKVESKFEKLNQFFFCKAPEFRIRFRRCFLMDWEIINLN